MGPPSGSEYSPCSTVPPRASLRGGWRGGGARFHIASPDLSSHRGATPPPTVNPSRPPVLPRAVAERPLKLLAAQIQGRPAELRRSDTPRDAVRSAPAPGEA